MSSHWPVVIRGVTALECLLILAMHGFFLFLLILKKRMTRAFRIVLIINAIHGIVFGVVILIVSSGHVFNNGNFVVCFFGTLIPVLPKMIQDALMVSLTVLCYMIWQLIPAPLIMQYLSLTRPKWGQLQRFALSYSFTLLYALYDLYFVIALVPTSGYENVLINVSRGVFDLDVNEQIAVYGLPLEALSINDEHGAVTLALGCVLPTYISSYLIFAALILMIHRHLRSFAVNFSAKTMELERRFYRVQLLQSLLPVVVISFPIAIFIIPSLFAASIGLSTLAMTFSVWIVPVVQGVVFVKFVRGPNKSTMVQKNSST